MIGLIIGGLTTIIVLAKCESYRLNSILQQEKNEQDRIAKISNMLPLLRLKTYIFNSNKKEACKTIDEVSSTELEEALLYLNNINKKTPKNKTRPIICREIQRVLRSRNE